MTTTGLLPQASLREAWTVATIERLAWAMGRPAAAPRSGSGRETTGSPSTSRPARTSDPVTARRRTEALLRLALDRTATVAERALAAERAAAYLRTTV